MGTRPPSSGALFPFRYNNISFRTGDRLRLWTDVSTLPGIHVTACLRRPNLSDNTWLLWVDVCWMTLLLWPPKYSSMWTMQHRDRQQANKLQHYSPNSGALWTDRLLNSHYPTGCQSVEEIRSWEGWSVPEWLNVCVCIFKKERVKKGCLTNPNSCHWATSKRSLTKCSLWW